MGGISRDGAAQEGRSLSVQPPEGGDRGKK